jgi:hypothetical protein
MIAVEAAAEACVQAMQALRISVSAAASTAIIEAMEGPGSAAPRRYVRDPDRGVPHVAPGDGA